MTVSAGEVRRRVDELSLALRESGLRLTHQRLEVVREVARSDEHPDVETIYLAVRERVPTISLDTVYRTLATLNGLGLVRRVAATPGPLRYDANTAHHHHFVCTRCGLIRDVDDRGLDAVRAPRSAASLGSVESIEVQLRGECDECKRREHEHELRSTEEADHQLRGAGPEQPGLSDRRQARSDAAAGRVVPGEARELRP